MPIKANIINSETQHEAHVDYATGEKQALIVATRPLKTFENAIKFFTNDEFGTSMNQDASFSGTPEKVHDGIDSILWTATDIVGGGRTTFSSGDFNHTGAGATSVKIDNAPVDDIFQFSKGSDLDMAGYTALTMWIYVDKDWDAGDSIIVYGWDTGTNSQVGTSISLERYFTFTSFDVWQKLTIPLTDLGTLDVYPTLDALRIEIATVVGKSPKWYIDDIQFEQLGIPAEYIIRPNSGTWLYIETITVSVADVYTSGVANDTTPRLPYNTLLGTTANNGLAYQQIQNGEIKESLILKSLIDVMQLPNATINSGSDGANTWMTITYPFFADIVLKAESSDQLKIIISDDLSTLLHLKASAGCKEEHRFLIDR